MKQQIAIYLRLSLEDVDKRTNKVKDESNSMTITAKTFPRRSSLQWE